MMHTAWLSICFVQSKKRHTVCLALLADASCLLQVHSGSQTLQVISNFKPKVYTFMFSMYRTIAAREYGSQPQPCKRQTLEHVSIQINQTPSIIQPMCMGLYIAAHHAMMACARKRRWLCKRWGRPSSSDSWQQPHIHCMTGLPRPPIAAVCNLPQARSQCSTCNIHCVTFAPPSPPPYTAAQATACTSRQSQQQLLQPPCRQHAACKACSLTVLACRNGL